MSPEEILTWVESQIWSKRQWLETHARGWPEHDVSMKRRDMEFLLKIKGHYQTWIEHKKGQAA